MVVKGELGCQTTPLIPPGGMYSGAFVSTVPAAWDVGSYTGRVVAWSDGCGSSDWLDSSDEDFIIDAAPLELDGRIAYHSYSGYLAAPVDGVDGNIFLYSIAGTSVKTVTASLAVENAMNPNFSPDGSRLVFMAIPQGAERSRNSLELYIFDLAKNELIRLTTNSIPDEDPKYSPDGRTIVFKRKGQVWTIASDGTGDRQLTTTSDEKSGPNFSPAGSRIVYWSSDGASADIWWVGADGTGASELVGVPGVQEYFPIYRDSGRVLYTRWESTSDHHDKIYEYSLAAGTSQRLPFNVTGVEDSDPFAVNASLLGFSSQRLGGKGGWDVYVANGSTGLVYAIDAINSSHHDLGATYSPYRYARAVEVLTPQPGIALAGGTSFLLRVRAYSDGARWNGALPRVEFSGPIPQFYTGLRDDGTSGDQVPGDGIYSKSVVLPSQPGSYALLASASSFDNGIVHEIVSAPLGVMLVALNESPTQLHAAGCVKGSVCSIATAHVEVYNWL